MDFGSIKAPLDIIARLHLINLPIIVSIHQFCQQNVRKIVKNASYNPLEVQGELLYNCLSYSTNSSKPKDIRYDWKKQQVPTFEKMQEDNIW